MFSSIWRQSAEIHYLAGKQDIGHEIQANIVRVCPDLYLLMQREAMLRD